MTGRDVAELYEFLAKNPNLHSNGFSLWWGIKEQWGRGASEDDEIKVKKAVARFRSKIPSKDI